MLLFFHIHEVHAQSEWLETESAHFKVLYMKAHAPLVPHIINSAENALEPLMKIFNYTPSEKIIINTFDISDHGFGAATTIPENYIRLEIEPFEPGYEVVPYNDRIQWTLSHEILHIVINDHSTNIESFFRSIFSKVAPEQPHPITVFYSLLTNFSRYTPMWHQEAIAVFIETWFSGGYGRILGNFDEMYFRSLVLENKKFATHLELETNVSHNSFLLEHSYYLYGTRFCTYLALKYDKEKLIQWFTPGKDDVYETFISKFKKIFNNDFENEWNSFIEFEKEFQQENISRLLKYSPTPVKYLNASSQGWVAQPYLLNGDSTVIFAYHKPHQLAGIQIFDLKTGESREIASVPSPSMQQVTSTAYDSITGLFFYTTNNNQLFRDVWVLSLSSMEKKLIFEDCRIGDLTVSPATHELWGVQNDAGNSSLVYSPYPYNGIIPLTQFNTGDEISQLSINHDGSFLAAVIHRASGEQSLIVVNADSLKNGSPFRFQTITNTGTPGNPSWSPDGSYIYWDAYVNGVSNIYRSGPSGIKEPLSHTLKGLFKPVQVNNDSLFCFEFSTEGFVPVVIPAKPAEYLPAIAYLGQKIPERDNSVLNWALKTVSRDSFAEEVSPETDYSGFSNLKVQTFIPVITGFQKQKVLGFLARIADPLLVHDITLEAGFSPFNKTSGPPKFHFRGKYEYMKTYEAGIDYNAPDFYDLFNERKRGMIGTRFRLGHNHFWIFDNPLKVKQTTDVALYTNVQYLNDNLVPVSQPDFLVAFSTYNYRNLRKSIGSADFEQGQEINSTVMFIASRPDKIKSSLKIYGDFAHMDTWIWPHNVFHLKAGGGYIFYNDDLYQANHFLGGFGNRALENVDVKQYRSLMRFPGLPMYSLTSTKFVKTLIENNFPPVRFYNAAVGQHYLDHIDYSVYSQWLLTDSYYQKWADVGVQLNFVFKHWFNLESTLSAGFAAAWNKKERFNEWFISYKLLRN